MKTSRLKLPALRCIVPGCESTSATYGITFYNVPRSSWRQIIWQKILQCDRICRDDRVCSRHFLEEDIINNSLRHGSLPMPTNLDIEDIISSDSETETEQDNDTPEPGSSDDELPRRKFPQARRCIVPGCRSTMKTTTCYGVPRALERQVMWQKILRCPRIYRSAQVCSLHFSEKDIINNYLRPGSLPLPLVRDEEISTDQCPQTDDDTLPEPRSIDDELPRPKRLKTRRCIVPGCGSTSTTPGITFYRVPRAPWRQAIWQKILKCPRIYRSAQVCSLHFSEKDIINKSLRIGSLPIEDDKNDM